jgi:hypothetical protein
LIEGLTVAPCHQPGRATAYRHCLGQRGNRQRLIGAARSVYDSRMRFLRRRSGPEAAAHTLSPTEEWVNPAGFMIWVPAHWEHERAELADGWVPPSGVGRLTRMPITPTLEPTPLDEEWVLGHAASFARSLGVAMGRLVVAAPDHMAALLSGQPAGRHVTAVVHAWGEARVTCVAWHTPDPRDPDRPDAVQAAWSLTPLREEDDDGRYDA